MFLYETHCHTKIGSACASLTPEKIVEIYVANGYDGVFITDHFLNGNTTVHRNFPNASYAEKIAAFCEGYKEVKAAAGDRLQVFFGLEFSYKGTDVLVYGWDEEQLKQMEYLPSMPMRALCDFCRERGVLAIQAHPFREAHYIDHIRLFPTVEGVESYNACREELCNRLGEIYADAYQKIKIGGSDIHHHTQKLLSGVAFSEKITSVQEFIDNLRAEKGKIVKIENKLCKE